MPTIMNINGRRLEMRGERIFVDGVEWGPLGENRQYMEREQQEPQGLFGRLGMMAGLRPTQPRTSRSSVHISSVTSDDSPTNPTFTGSGTITGDVEGSVNITGSNVEIHIHGDVGGNVNGAAAVTVRGDVDGNVQGEAVNVGGDVDGNVTASVAHVVGDVSGGFLRR